MKLMAWDIWGERVRNVTVETMRWQSAEVREGEQEQKEGPNCLCSYSCALFLLRVDVDSTTGWELGYFCLFLMISTK